MNTDHKIRGKIDKIVIKKLVTFTELLFLFNLCPWTTSLSVGTQEGHFGLPQDNLHYWKISKTCE